MKLFVVGQYVESVESGSVWDMHGVFDTEKEAVENCNSANYFVGPVDLNKPFPHERIEWPDCYYPLAGE